MKKNKIFRLSILMLLVVATTHEIAAQTISGLSNNTYTENSSPIIIDSDVSITGGSGYGGGYLLFNLTNGTVNDQLGVTSDANPNANGAISFSGGNLYLGNGTGKDVVGSIDGTLNGQNGQDLKINFTSNFANSSFESGLGGWTVGQSMVDLGITQILGYTTPNDPTPTPYSNNDGDSDVPIYSTYNYQLSTSQATDGTQSLRLYSSMTTAEGCDIVHGPYVYSSVFSSTVNDVIYFDWRAFAGSDAYDVFGYILNVNTGATTIVLNQTGSSASGSTNWATASVTVPATGDYRFVFVSGTYDFTCGRAAGASLYIDNVRVFGDNINPTVITNIMRKITYQNTCGTSDATRNLTVSIANNSSVVCSANSTISLTTYAPTAVCKTGITVNLDANGQAIISGTDLDNGSSDACPITLTPSQGTFTCSDVGTNPVSLTVTDSYGNTASCNSIVTVNPDNMPPVAVCKNITIPMGSSGNVSITSSQVDNGSYDNCGPVSLSVSPSALSCGSNTVVLTVTDGNNNSSTCNATVTVSDNIPPTISCPANINAYGTTALGGPVNYTIPVGTDNCSGATTTLIGGLASGAFFPMGNTTVTYKVTDASNQTAQCSFIVNVSGVPPSINCPADITVNNDAGVCGANVSFTATETAGVPASTITYSPPSGSLFPIGTTTVTATATNPIGTSSCTFNVTVIDNEAPTITCPGNIAVNTDAGVCGTVVTYSVSSSDNCPGQTIAQTAGLASGSTFPVGTTTNTFVVTDAANNTATCSFDVTVTDNEAPIVSGCPANITTNNLIGNCFQTAIWWAPTFTDNCSVATVTETNDNGVVIFAAPCCPGKKQGAFPVGVTTVTYTAIDVNGNITVCSFTITVIDIDPPTINNCPPNITVNNTPTKCQNDQVFWTPPTPSDNCPSWNMTASHYPGQSFPVGVTTVSYVLTDNANHTTTCSFTITVIDNEPPVAICQNLVLYLDANGQASATAAQLDNGSHDNCGIGSLTLSKYNFDCSNVGVNTVTLTVLDVNGNSSTCTCTVTIYDNIAPVVLTKNINVYLNAAGQASIVAADVDNGAYDNCPFTLVVVPNTFNCNNMGPNTVTLTATDASGNITSGTAVVTVIDNIPPTFTRPADITIYSDANCNYDASVSVTGDVSDEADNCSTGLNATYIDVTVAGNCLGTKIITRTWSLVDNYNNTTTQIQTITVLDITAPVIATLPAPSTINCPNTPVFTVATATDACGGTVTLTFVDVTTNGQCAGQYSVTRTWTATDDCSNTSTASQTINVQDVDAPVISALPASSTINCPATPVFAVATATDACGGTVTLTYADVTTNGNCAGDYSVTRTWTATDDCSNTSTASQTINVQDVDAPVISALPALSTINCPATPVFAVATATDACGSAFTLTYADVTTNGNCAGQYSVTRTWTATDVCGNISTASQTINVQDVDAPVIAALPAPSTINCPATPVFAVATATDACGSAFSLTSADVTTNGSSAGQYSITRTWTATDACGNISTASQTINVQDVDAPVISALPASSTINCPNTPMFATPTVTDACGSSITLTSSDVTTPGACAGSYSVTRTWTATDASNNSSTASQTINVIDTDAPVISALSAPSTINCPAVPVFDIATATDACGSAFTLTSADITTPGACAGSYSVTRTWTALDACGNSSTASQTINVQDVDAPVIAALSAPSTINCSATPVFDVATAVDACGSAFTLTSADVTTPGACAGSYSITRTWTAMDACGNSSTASQTINVIDTDAPVIAALPAPSTISCPNTPVFVVPTATDACGSAITWTFTDVTTNGNCLGEYSVTRKWTATDACSNSSIASQTISVIDNVAPTFTRPADITIYKDANCNYNASVSATGDVTDEADNCSTGLNAAFYDMVVAGNCQGTKIITRTWILVDNCGNHATNQLQTITVLDNIAPTFTRPADITIYTDANCNYDASVSATGNVTDEDDNCSTGLNAHC